MFLLLHQNLQLHKHFSWYKQLILLSSSASSSLFLECVCRSCEVT